MNSSYELFLQLVHTLWWMSETSFIVSWCRTEAMKRPIHLAICTQYKFSSLASLYPLLKHAVLSRIHHIHFNSYKVRDILSNEQYLSCQNSNWNLLGLVHCLILFLFSVSSGSQHIVFLMQAYERFVWALCIKSSPGLTILT